MGLTRDELLNALRQDAGVDTARLQDDTPLFSAGIIDSFSLTSLIAFVEAKVGIRVEPMEVNLDNFDTVARILRFANRPADAATTGHRRGR